MLKAIVLREFRMPLSLEVVDVPTKGKVLMNVAAAPVLFTRAIARASERRARTR